MKKVITLGLAIILCLLLVLPSTSYASGFAIKQYFESAGSQPTFETISSQIYVVLRTFGLILAVCILVTIAISYMVATPNKRAILKERLVYYVAGVVFLLAGVGFLGWYEKVANDIASTVSDGNVGAHAMSYEDTKTLVNNLSAEISELKKQKKQLEKEYDELLDYAKKNGTTDPRDPYYQAANNKLKEINAIEETIEQKQADYDYYYQYLKEKYNNQN